jgi:hypothetical protein
MHVPKDIAKDPWGKSVYLLGVEKATARIVAIIERRIKELLGEEELALMGRRDADASAAVDRRDELEKLLAKLKGE